MALGMIPTSMADLLTETHIINTFLLYKGTMVDCLMRKETAIKRAEERINDLLSKCSLADLREDFLSELNDLEADLCKEFHDGHTMKDVCKFWGVNATKNLMNWVTGVILLLKTKVIENDDMNGWLIIATPNEPSQTIPRGKLFQQCAGCDKVAYFKKCSGCKKVHYCSRECQKAHWKTHKPHCFKA